MIKHSHPTAPLSSFNHRLAIQLRNKNKPKTVLDNVLKIVAEIKEQNLRMDQTTYNAILSAYSRNKDQTSIKRTLKEMKENGLVPSADSYNIALEVREATARLFYGYYITELSSSRLPMLVMLDRKSC
jgi:pentatricopeptide repeat protein